MERQRIPAAPVRDVVVVFLSRFGRIFSRWWKEEEETGYCRIAGESEND